MRTLTAEGSLLDLAAFLAEHADLPLEEFRRRHPHPVLLLETRAGEPLPETGLKTARSQPPPPLVLPPAVPPAPLADRLACVAKDADTPYSGLITVGRARTNDVVLRFDTVSKFHGYFRLDPRSGRYRVTDAGSTNGTLVNRLPLEDGESVELRDGDVVDFGGVLPLTYFTPEGFHRCLPVLRRRFDSGMSQSR